MTDVHSVECTHYGWSIDRFQAPYKEHKETSGSLTQQTVKNFS